MASEILASKPDMSNIESTYVVCNVSWLAILATKMPHRWKFLEPGISQIMMHLANGMDLRTVSSFYRLGKIGLTLTCST